MQSLTHRVLSALAYLALTPWLSIFSVVIIAVGLSLSAGLAVTVVGGLFVLGLTLAAARALGNLQRVHVAAATGVPIDPPRPMRRNPGFWGWLTGPLGDGAGWKAIAFWFLELIFGVLGSSIVFALLSAGVVAATLPLYAGRLRGAGDDLPGLVLAFGVAGGIVVLIAACAIAVGAVQLHHGLARALLRTDRTAELEARVTDLGVARSAAIDAAESERRRLERDLHDGAQQRLVSLAMDLGMAREKFDTDPDRARALVDDAHREVKATMAELRSLTRGFRPSVLEDRGLDAALSALAARSPVPVDVAVHLPQRPPPAIESAAYFVAAEALTNVAKHAAAGRATVLMGYDDGNLVVEVLDDGRGGAARLPGGGLDGLADRVAAFEGRLSLSSPAGGPTILRAEIPCAS